MNALFLRVYGTRYRNIKLDGRLAYDLSVRRSPLFVMALLPWRGRRAGFQIGWRLCVHSNTHCECSRSFHVKMINLHVVPRVLHSGRDVRLAPQSFAMEMKPSDDLLFVMFPHLERET